MKNENYKEIDIINLLRVLWRNKYKMIVIIFLSLLSGLSLSVWKNSKLQYEVSIPYSIIYYPIRIQEICNNAFGCMKEQTSNKLRRLTERGWEVDSENERFYITASVPLESQEYSKMFNKLNIKITEEIYNLAKNDLNLIKNTFGSMTETLTNNQIKNSFMRNQRLIYSIENGQQALFIGDVNIKKQPSPAFQIMFLSLELSYGLKQMQLLFFVQKL